MYSEKATKFCKISTVDLNDVTQDKYLVEMLQKIVAFSQYMNFILTFSKNRLFKHILKYSKIKLFLG